MGRSDAPRFDHCRRRLSAMIKPPPYQALAYTQRATSSRCDTLEGKHMFSTCTSSTLVNHAARNACAPVPSATPKPVRATWLYNIQCPFGPSKHRMLRPGYSRVRIPTLTASSFISMFLPCTSPRKSSGRPHQKCVSLSGIAPKAQIRVLRLLRQRQ